MRENKRVATNMVISQRSRVIIFQVVLPLVIGTLVYALLRRQPPFAQHLPWDNPVFDVSFLPRFLYIFVVYRLPGLTWAFAFIRALDMKLKRPIVSAFIVIAVNTVYEYFQYRGIFTGTGDVGDVFYALCAVIIYILIWGRDKNERKI